MLPAANTLDKLHFAVVGLQIRRCHVQNIENLGSSYASMGSRILRDFRRTKYKKRGFVERVRTYQERAGALFGLG